MHFALLSLVLVLGAQPLVATTYYVTLQPLSPCTSNKSGISMFFSIQDAVDSVPAGSTINVCSGTYAEQVVISKPLTLRGVSYGNADQAVIAMPSTALVTTTSIYFGTVAAQVQVTAGPVKISNITVDGTPVVSGCPGNATFAILYSSGSSGTVNEVGTRNQNCNGIGIGAENGSGAPESVAIENNNIITASYMGIFACSEGSPSTLTVSIKSNYVGQGEFGIVPYCNVAGSVSGNVVSWAGTDIYAGSPSTTVSGNTVIGLAGTTGIEVDGGTEISNNSISGAKYGLYLVLPGTITSNHILNSSGSGIFFEAGSGGSTVRGNIITQAAIGIEFGCTTNTVSGNTINGATTGLDSVPASFTGVNTFYNVGTNATSGGC
jgi:parallel beta-helix repeat protein